MKGIGLILFVAGICYCIAGFAGHSAAWSTAAICFSAATVIYLGKRKPPKEQ